MSERLRLLHLSGPRRAETDVLESTPAGIGSDPGLEVVIAGLAPRHAFLLRRDTDIVLQDSGSEEGTFLAGVPVREAVLRDGDVIELGAGGPKLRFRSEGAARVSILQALKWARPDGAPAGLSDTTGFLRAAASETVSRLGRGARLALVAGLLAAIGFAVWSYREDRRVRRDLHRLQDALGLAQEDRHRFEARITEERERSETARRTLENRTEEFRQREEILNRQIADAASGEVQTLRKELATTRDRLAALESEREAAERIIRDFGGSVCLIQGAYSYHDASGRPLREKLDEAGEPSIQEDGSQVLEVEGDGPVHTVSYFGTGFLADRRGLILTNHHVAEPWWNDKAAETLAGAGFQPRLMRFRAFFPATREPVDVTTERISETTDLALLRIKARSPKLAVVPLDGTGRGAVAGQPVVVVGYPTGLEAILAKADGSVVREVLEANGTSSEKVTEALSRRGLIRPSTTQGHIGDITKTDIVFDAPTTQGGSGGPVFNRNGQVVAVEYAVLPKFGGNAFGIPIRYAFDLLNPKVKKATGD